jgi:hypothetical protein
MIFLSFSACLLGVGYLAHNRADDNQFARAQFGIGLMILGGVSMLISFIGCCGAWRENRCLTKLYIAILVTLILAEAAIGAAAIVYHDKAENAISDKWDQTSIADRVNWQNEFDCCGLWKFNDTNAAQPCPAESSDGCINKLGDELKQQYRIVAGVILAIAAAEILGVIFASCLCRELRHPTAEEEDEERLRQAKEYNRAAFGAQQV